MTRLTRRGKARLVRHLEAVAGSGSNRVVPSSYRFSGPFVVRLMGAGLAVVGVLVLLLVALVALFALPGAVLSAGVVLAVLAVLALGLAARRRAVVVRLDDTGYRIRYVRGAGVRQAAWKQVEDATAATIAGERCVVLRLRDGRTSTVPVGVLAVRPEAFVEDLQQHLNRGHGYRPVPRRTP